MRISYLRAAILMLASIFYSTSHSCAWSDEYYSAYSYVYGDKSACELVIHKIDNQFKYFQCVLAGDGNNVGGGCAHVLGNGGNSSYSKNGISRHFCWKIIKLSAEQKRKLLEWIVKINNIDAGC